MESSVESFKRHHFSTILARLREPRRNIQIVFGPRQVGKTTLVRQVSAEFPSDCDYFAADALAAPEPAWIEQVWGVARRALADRRQGTGRRVLVIDEVQKIPRWADMVKLLWDQDTAAGRDLHVVLLGSSPLLIRQGLGESLAGRFELIRMMHWSWPEMQQAFGWDLETFVCHGGYPGAAPLLSGPGDTVARWAAYIRDSLVEPALTRDIADLQRIRKPALLRRLFELGTAHAGQILSYNKMLGQLDEAGNTTTLAEYLTLLEQIGMMAGLEKYDPSLLRRKRSSPKLAVFNTALMTALRPEELPDLRRDPVRWGRLVEAAVGAHLLNEAATAQAGLHYWRDRDLEVDYVVSSGSRLLAIEVKSGIRLRTQNGMQAFRRNHPEAKRLIVGAEGMPLDVFFRSTVGDLL